MTVSIIGVGPGDAELMTLRAARLLGEAQAAVYDRLIGHDVLQHLSPLAERHDVGKTPGRPGPSQKHINDLLTDLGSRLDRVVRIKGGDPYVFGRGIEEVRACEAAGIDVEVVPGISSALFGPLSAGISITEREVSSGFCVVTAHQDPGSDPLDWSALVRSGLTIIVLMGARRARDVRDALLAAGLSCATPAAVATDAGRPDQHSWFGPLGELGVRPVRSPSVLVIGDAAGRAVTGAATRRPAVAVAASIDAAHPAPTRPVPGPTADAVAPAPVGGSNRGAQASGPSPASPSSPP